jgi:hypothetical protein
MPTRSTPWRVLRLVRKHRRRLDDGSRRVNHANLDAGAQAGIDAHHGAPPGRGRHQQVAQAPRVVLHGVPLGLLPQPSLDLHLHVRKDLHLPRTPYDVEQPGVGRPPFIPHAEAFGDHLLGHAGRLASHVAHARRYVRGCPFDRRVRRRVGRRGRRRDNGRGCRPARQHERQAQHAFLPPAEQREDTVRRQRARRLAEGKVLGELRALFLPALDDLGLQHRVREDVLAERVEQARVLGEPLHQDPARAVERRDTIRNALLRVDETVALFIRRKMRTRQQQVGQRLQADLARLVGAAAALLLERQVEVFEARPRIGRGHQRLEFGRQAPLLADRLEDEPPALVQFANQLKAIFDGAEMGQRQPARRLFPIPGEERHGGSLAQQAQDGFDLVFPNPKLSGYPADGRLHNTAAPGTRANILANFERRIPEFQPRRYRTRRK